MAKAKKAPAVGAPNVWAMTYAEGLAMEQADRIIRFKVETEAGQRAYIAIGKLYDIINDNLPKGKFINSTLEAAGIKPGTISNASYGARCYREFVKTGKLEETEFDQLTFQEMWNLIRVCSEKSKRKLTPEQAVEIVRQGGDFEANLKSLYEFGFTAEEKAAAEAKIKADKEKTEAEAKAKAEAQAKELAEVKKRNEELAKANADMTAQAAAVQSPAPAAPAAPAPAAPETPAQVEARHVAEAIADAAAPTPAAKPEADPTASCDELLALLGEVETSMAYLSDEDQGRIGARLCAMASAFVESGKAVAA
jgi:hypothetical protein